MEEGGGWGCHWYIRKAFYITGKEYVMGVLFGFVVLKHTALHYIIQANLTHRCNCSIDKNKKNTTYN